MSPEELAGWVVGAAAVVTALGVLLRALVRGLRHMAEGIAAFAAMAELQPRVLELAERIADHGETLRRYWESTDARLSRLEAVVAHIHDDVRGRR